MPLAYVFGMGNWYNSHGKTFTKEMTSPQIRLCEVPMFLHLVFGLYIWRWARMAKGKLIGTVSKTQELYTLPACHQKPNAETQAIQSDGLDKEYQKENS